jgi:hypothetical protein
MFNFALQFLMSNPSKKIYAFTHVLYFGTDIHSTVWRNLNIFQIAFQKSGIYS